MCIGSRMVRGGHDTRRNRVRRLRIYVDTSVFGGTADEEFREPSRRLFGRVAAGEFTVLLSD